MTSFGAVRCLCLFHLGAALGLAAEPVAGPGKQKGSTVLVTPGEDGRLRYSAYSENGDTLPDFSHCGYGGGGVPLPDAVVLVTLSPEPGNLDDTARIQSALDRVAAQSPDAHGMRGAVLLKRGDYRCAGILRITQCGVVLRGEGAGRDGTVITATARRQQALVQIGGETGPQAIPGSQTEITDAYVPVGARSFNVATTEGFAVGQSVFVVRRGNAAWISEIGMDRIVPRPGVPASTRQWRPFDLKFDRVIVRIEGSLVTVDAPIACAIENRWGGGALMRIGDGDRIGNCGIESLRAVSVFDKSVTALHRGERIYADEDHATHLVVFGSVKNAWARRLTAIAFYHGVADVTDRAKWVTVEDCASLEPVSQITGGRRYPFNINGQLVLVRGCFSSEARHAFVFGARVPGPNVFLDCRSERDYTASEPHHRWSVGGLYDNVSAQIAIQDRQWMGTGHGWAGANYVVWNSSGTLICQKPPTAQNFAIGFTGKRGKDAFPRPPGWWESEGVPVSPRSLYLAQLEDRLGGRR